MAQKKLALSMRGGLARAAGYVGVLKALEENDIQVHMLVGSSMGAIIAALYGLGHSVAELMDLSKTLKLKDLMGIDSVHDAAMLSDQKVLDRFSEVVGDKDVGDTQIKLWIQVTNLDTKSTDYLEKGPLKLVLAASMAYPLFMNPIEINGTTYADGDIAAGYGTQFLRDHGAEVVIGLCPGINTQAKLPDHYMLLTKVIEPLTIAGLRIKQLEQELEPADLLFDNLGKDASVMALDRIPELVDFGYHEASERMEEIKKLVFKKRWWHFA